MSQVPAGQRNVVVEIISQSKFLPTEQQGLLLKKGLLRRTAEELEISSETDDDIDDVLSRPEKVSPALLTLLQPAVDEVKATSSSPS